MFVSWIFYYIIKVTGHSGCFVDIVLYIESDRALFYIVDVIAYK